MTDAIDMDNDNSGNIEIDFDFDDGLIDLEDISDEKNGFFEEIDEDEAVADFSDMTHEDITPVGLTEEIEDNQIIDLVEVVQNGGDSAAEDDEVIDLVNVVNENLPSAIEDDKIIDLVDVVEAVDIHDHLSAQHDHASVAMEEGAQRLPSEEQIESMLQKAIEKRYAEKLDTMLSEIVETVLNRQMDNIRKKILAALQDENNS